MSRATEKQIATKHFNCCLKKLRTARKLFDKANDMDTKLVILSRFNELIDEYNLARIVLEAFDEESEVAV